MKKDKVKKVKIHPVLRETPNWMFVTLGVFLGLLVLSGFFMTIDTSITGAATSLTDDIKSFIDSVKEIGGYIAGFLLGEDAGKSGGVLFTKLLISFAVFGVIFFAFSKTEFIGDHKGMAVLVFAAVSIVATRWLTKELIEGYLMVSGVTVVVAVFSILLFGALFYVIEILFERYPFVRKVLWIFSGILFFGVWYSIRKDKGDAPWVYILTAVAAISMAWADGIIQRSIKKSKWGREQARIMDDAIIGFRRKAREYNEQLASGDLLLPQYNQKMGELNKSVEAVFKHRK